MKTTKWMRHAIVAAAVVGMMVGRPAPASAAQSGFCQASPISGLASIIQSGMGAVQGIEGLMTSAVAFNAALQAGVTGSTHTDTPIPMMGFASWSASNGLTHDLALMQQVEQLQQQACATANETLAVTQGTPNFDTWAQGASGGIGDASKLVTDLEGFDPEAGQAVVTNQILTSLPSAAQLAAWNEDEAANPAGQTAAIQAHAAIDSQILTSLQESNMQAAAAQAAAVAGQIQAYNDGMAAFDLNGSNPWSDSPL